MIRLFLLFSLLGTLIRAERLKFSQTLGNGKQTSADAVATDLAGNIYLAGSTLADGLATAGAAQSARMNSGDVYVAKYGREGGLLWLTYLGGNDVDLATGIAVDSQGSVYVCGNTFSHDFPVVHAYQPKPDPAAYGSRFVTKLSGDGSTILYSTYLRGRMFETVEAIAVDADGSAYLTGMNAFVTKVAADGASLVYSIYLDSNSFNHGYGIAVDAVGQAYITGVTHSADAFAVKLDRTGGRVLYTRYLGGRGQETGRAIAVDALGNAYITGDTTSADFPRLSGYQSSLNAHLAAKSTDGGVNWTALAEGFITTWPRALLIDPRNTSTLYVPTFDYGVLKSVDGGASWSTANVGLPVESVMALSLSPADSSVLFASVGGDTVYKSSDGGKSWVVRGNGLPQFHDFEFFAFDPQVLDTVYVGGNGVYRSVDGGASWSKAPLDSRTNSLLINPQNSKQLFAGVSSFFFSPGIVEPGGLFQSDDGGASFRALFQSPPPTVERLAGIDPAIPSILYGYTHGIEKSLNGGALWRPIGPDIDSFSHFSDLAIDPGKPSTIYGNGSAGLYRSLDRGESWTVLAGAPQGLHLAAVVPKDSATLYALGGPAESDAFVVKLDSAGEFVYSTYFGGTGAEIAHGIAVGADGRAVITGSTTSSDLPLSAAIQQSFGGGPTYDLGDIFVARFSADGSTLEFGTYLGDAAGEAGRAVTVDSEGNMIVAAHTSAGFTVQGTVLKIVR